MRLNDNSEGHFMGPGWCINCSAYESLRVIVQGGHILCRSCALIWLLQHAEQGPYPSAEDAAEGYHLVPADGDGANELRLVAACVVAQVELGEFDRQVIAALSNECQPAVVQVLVGLICRAAAR